MFYLKSMALVVSLFGWFAASAQMSGSLDVTFTIENAQVEFVRAEDDSLYKVSHQSSLIKIGDYPLNVLAALAGMASGTSLPQAQRAEAWVTNVVSLALVDVEGEMKLSATVGYERVDPRGAIAGPYEIPEEGAPIALHEDADAEEDAPADPIVETLLLGTVLTRGTYQDYLDGEAIELYPHPRESGRTIRGHVQTGQKGRGPPRRGYPLHGRPVLRRLLPEPKPHPNGGRYRPYGRRRHDDVVPTGIRRPFGNIYRSVLPSLYGLCRCRRRPVLTPSGHLGNIEGEKDVKVLRELDET